MSGCEVGCDYLKQIHSDSCWPGWVRSVVVHCPWQIPATLPLSHCSFSCRTNYISQLCIMSWKTTQCRKLTRFPSIVTMIVLHQFLPLALSQHATGRLLKMVSKPARNLRGPRANQAPVKHVDCYGGSQA